MRKHPSSARRLRDGLLAGAATSFGLTFAALAACSLAGLLPRLVMPFDVDMAVVLLVVPVAALFLAILLEVIRAGIVHPAPRPRSVDDHVLDWRAGSDLS